MNRHILMSRVWQRSVPRMQRGRYRIGVLIVLIFGVLSLPSTATFSVSPPSPLQQPLPDDISEANRLLVEARAQREKALFDEDLAWAELQSQEALKSFREAADRDGEARALDELGLIALKRRQVSQAINHFEQALAVARAMSDQAREARVLEHLSRAYMTTDDRQALASAERALALYRQVRDRDGEFTTLIQLGQIHEQLEQPAQAVERYQQALALARQQDDSRSIAMALENLATIYQRSGRVEPALSAGRQALEAHRRADHRVSEAYALARLGEIAREAGRDEEATAFYQQALAASQEMKATALEWKLHARLAGLHQSQGQATEARSSFESAMTIIESTPTELLSDDRDRTIRMEAQQALRDYVDFLLRAEYTPVEISRAFSLSEQVRARAFLKWMDEARLSIYHGVNPLQRERERGILQRQYDLRAALQAPGVAETERQSYQEQLSEAEEDLNAFEVDMRRVWPRYAELRYPSVPTIESLRERVLSADEVFLEYLLGTERSYLFVITREKVAAYLLPSAEEVERTVKSYQSILTQTSMDTEALAMGRRLYDMLIGPASEFLRGQSHLIIVPDGRLCYLPFETLIREARESRVEDEGSAMEDRAWRYLIEEYTVSYAPSVTLLDWLRHKERPVNDRMLLVREDQSRAQASSEKGGAGSSSLPDHDPEARAIESALGARFIDQRRQAPDEAVPLATEELGRYRLLHFAVPSLIDEPKPAESGVMISVQQESEKAEALRAPAIFNIGLGADLTVLSRCQPRLGEPVSGMGWVSLSRSFFYAGTPTVVASLWDADAQSTGELMEAFYEALQTGQSKREAMRAAKLKLWQGQSYRQPVYWARFVLIGDGSGTVRIESAAQLIVIISAGVIAILLVIIGVVVWRRGAASRRAASSAEL